MANERENLIDRYVRGEATGDEVAQLFRSFNSNPKSIQEVLAAAEMERDLHEVFKTADAAKARARRSVSTLPVRNNKTPGRFKTLAWASLAAAVVISVTLVLLRNNEPPEIARVAETSGNAARIRDGYVSIMKNGASLSAGDQVRVPVRGSLIVEYKDKTRVTIGSGVDGESLVIFEAYSAQPVPEGVQQGKKIRLEAGVIAADVTPQPAGKPMLIATSTATAEVVGTQLRISVEKQSTRLDVLEGKVRLQRAEDKAITEVSSGQFAVAAKDTKFVAQKMTPPNIGPKGRIFITADDGYQLYVNGRIVGRREWPKGVSLYETQMYEVDFPPGRNTVAVIGRNIDNIAGVIAEIQLGARRFATGKNWKVASHVKGNWVATDYNDSSWDYATEYGSNRQVDGTRHVQAQNFPWDSEAQYIWTANNHYTPSPSGSNEAYFRFTFDASFQSK